MKTSILLKVSYPNINIHQAIYIISVNKGTVKPNSASILDLQCLKVIVS